MTVRFHVESFEGWHAQQVLEFVTKTCSSLPLAVGSEACPLCNMKTSMLRGQVLLKKSNRLATTQLFASKARLKSYCW
jgi:hypothetical protein